MISTLLFFIIQALAASAPGGTAPLCMDLFSLATSSENLAVPANLQTQTAKLAPQLDYDKGSLESLYISLLGEDLISRTRTAQELSHLGANFGERYNMPTDVKALQLFYSNSLSSLYSRVAWEWKKQVVEQIIGRPLGKSLLTAQALMDSFFFIRGFGERPDSLQGIPEFFAAKSWKDFNWTAALEISERWLGSPEAAQGFTGFYKWHERQTDLPALSFEDLERLFLAITKKPTPVVCCKSSYACSSCPHNRGLLKKGED